MNAETRTADTAKLRVVVDTNVLIRGLLSDRGSATEVVNRWLADEFALLASEQTLSECERILDHPKLQEHLSLDINPTNELMGMLRDQTHKVEAPVPAMTRVVRNPFDELILTTGVAGNADYLVTEEDELLALGEREGVKIVTPERFIRILKAE